MIASRHPNTPVEPGDKLCGTRIIPLVIKKDKMEAVKKLCGGKKIFSILPYKNKKIGIVTTGSEVYCGKVKDAFGPVLRAKAEEFGGEILGQTVTDDKPEHTSEAILEFIRQGADMVLVSGGMSVDPDDKTPLAIRNTGAEVVSYGAPVLPGAMFLLAYYRKDGKNIPVAGLPGCVMYSKRTVFDLVLPRLMADDPITKEELDKLGKGGCASPVRNVIIQTADSERVGRMKILIKGAGDLASGIACRLHRCGFLVVMTEIPVPTTVRRTVAFSRAVYENRTKVETLPEYYVAAWKK